MAVNYQEGIDKPLDFTSLCLGEALGAAAAQFPGIAWGCAMKPAVFAQNSPPWKGMGDECGCLFVSI